MRIPRIVAGVAGLVLISGALLGAAAVTTPPPVVLGTSSLTVDCSSLAVDHYTTAIFSMPLQNLQPNTEYAIEVSTTARTPYDTTFTVTTDPSGAASLDTPVTGAFAAGLRYIENVTLNGALVARQAVSSSACATGLTPVVSLDPTVDCPNRFNVETNGYPVVNGSTTHLTGVVRGLLPTATYSLDGAFTFTAVADASGVATFSIPDLKSQYIGPGEGYNWNLFARSQGPAVAMGTVQFSDHCSPLPLRQSFTHDYDISGDGFADLLSIDKKGALRYYPNNSHSNPGHVPFMSNLVIGSGWTAMLNPTAGDVTGDGRADIVAAAPDGTLKMYINDFSLSPEVAIRRLVHDRLRLDRENDPDVHARGLQR